MSCQGPPEAVQANVAHGRVALTEISAPRERWTTVRHICVTCEQQQVSSCKLQ